MRHQRPLPKKFGLQGGTRNLRIEWHNGCWCVWLAANADFTIGSFLRLGPNGKIERVVWREGEGEEVFEYQEGADDEEPHRD